MPELEEVTRVVGQPEGRDGLGKAVERREDLKAPTRSDGQSWAKDDSDPQWNNHRV